MSELGCCGRLDSVPWALSRWNDSTWKEPCWWHWRKKNSVPERHKVETLSTPNWTFGARLGTSDRRRRLRRPKRPPPHRPPWACQQSRWTNPVRIWATCWRAGSTPRRISNNRNNALPATTTCSRSDSTCWPFPAQHQPHPNVEPFLPIRITRIPARKTWPLKVRRKNLTFIKKIKLNWN